TRYRLDLAARAVTEEGVAVDLHAVDGFPDGMTDAGDGSAIIAIYNPGAAEQGRALRYDLRSGEPREEWTTPGSPRVTCPLLAARDAGVKLVLTTEDEGMPQEQLEKCPHAGDLFLADTSLKN